MSVKPGPFFAALATVLMLVVALEVSARGRLDPETIANGEPLALLAHERDDHGRVMDSVLNIAEGERADVFVVGGSTVREGFLPDAIVQAELDRVAGSASPLVTTLYSFDQSLGETARIIGNLPLAPGDTVVISVNPRRLGFGPDSWSTEFGSSRLAMLDVSPLANIASQLPDTSSSLFGESIDAPSNAKSWFSPWTKLTIFEKRLFVRNWLEGRLPSTTSASWGALTSAEIGQVEWAALADLETRSLRRPLRYGFSTTALDAEEKAEIAAAVADERVPAFEEHYRFDASVLAALAVQVEQAGAEVVFLQLPRSPLSTNAYAPVWDTYDAVLADVAALAAADVIDLRGLDFADDEFFDLEHLLPEGRPELTTEFFQALLDRELSFS